MCLCSDADLLGFDVVVIVVGVVCVFAVFCFGGGNVCVRVRASMCVCVWVGGLF